MRLQTIALATCIALCSTPLCFAGTDPVVAEPRGPQAAGVSTDPATPGAVTTASVPGTDDLQPGRESSSNAPLADAPLPAYMMESMAAAGGGGGGRTRPLKGLRPVSALAMRLKFGSGGIGLDLGTNLTTRLNLRLGASFFLVNPQFSLDGIQILGGIDFRSVTTSLDIFPFNGFFRISPGLYLYNDNHISAAAFVPGGQTFDLNNVTFTSSTTDPVNGHFAMQYGRRVAPTLTVGFGNMVPRDGSHWSFTTEIGVGFIGSPDLHLDLGGSACYQGNCGKLTSDPTLVADVKAEERSLTDSFNSTHGIFPLISTGISYSFRLPGRH